MAACAHVIGRQDKQLSKAKLMKKPPRTARTVKPSIKQQTPGWLWGFIALLVLLPLPFGSNRPWAADLMGVLSATLLLLMLWQEKDEKPWQGELPLKRLFAAALGFSTVILWSVIQALPWTPLAWHHPLWIDAAAILGPVSGAISVDPGVLLESLVRIFSYIVFFLLAFSAGRDRKHAALILKSLSFAAAFYALYGIFAYAAGTEMILWFKKWAYTTFLTSTFVNKNSYAAYAGMGLLCALSLTHLNFTNARLKEKELAKKSVLLVFLEKLSLTQMMTLLIPIVMLAALSLSGSRAGIISSFCGVLTLFVALAANHRARFKKVFLISAALLGLFLFFVFLGGQTLITRFDINQFGEDAQMRLSGYALALQAITDNPWLGFGLGTFDTAFRLYRDSSLPLWFHHAHNDYLEMMMDLGVPVALILFSSIATLISCCISGIWNRKRDIIYPALALGVSGIIIVHSLFDFSMHMPAIAATYATILGLGVAQSWSTQKKTA